MLLSLTITKALALEREKVAFRGLELENTGGSCSLKTATTNFKMPPFLQSSWYS